MHKMLLGKNLSQIHELALDADIRSVAAESKTQCLRWG